MEFFDGPNALFADHLYQFDLMSLRIVYKIRRRQSLPIYGDQLDRRDGVVARAHALSG